MKNNNTTAMLQEHLMKAAHDATFALNALRDAHTEAINTGNHFAELVIFNQIQRAAELQNALSTLSEVATRSKA